MEEDKIYKKILGRINEQNVYKEGIIIPLYYYIDEKDNIQFDKEEMIRQLEIRIEDVECWYRDLQWKEARGEVNG